MGLAQRIDLDLKEAMKAREAGRARLSVLRLLKAAAKNEEVRLGRPLSEDEWLAAVSREVRQREEARPDLARSGRSEIVAKLDEEVRLLRQYLPEPMGSAELEKVVAEVARELGASGKGDLGRMMGALLPRLRGRVDGNAVRQAVERQLGG